MSDKKINPWVEHVKKIAKEKGISYMCAVSLPETKKSYQQPTKPKPEGKRALAQKKEKERIELLEKQPENKDILDNLIQKIARRKTAKQNKESKKLDEAFQRSEGVPENPYEKKTIKELEDRIALMLKEPKRFTDYPEDIMQEIKPLMDILAKKKAMKKNQEKAKEKAKIKKDKAAKEKDKKEIQGLSF
jgi:hypothetical protein